MGGVDTRGRYHVHWGPPETYGERRDESALRRSGRTVPDRNYEHFGEIDLAAVDAILDEHDFDPKKLLPILEGVQEAYGYLPVAAVKHISFRTGAWYAFIYGTATYYRHLRFVPPADQIGTAAFDAARPAEQRYVNVLAAALAGQPAPDRARDLDDALAGPAQNKPRPRRGSGKVH
jgi:hypothetical protein